MATSDSLYLINDEDAEFSVKEISDFCTVKTPDGWGHLVMLFKYGENSKIFFMSTVERDSMVEALESFIKTLKEHTDAGRMDTPKTNV